MRQSEMAVEGACRSSWCRTLGCHLGPPITSTAASAVGEIRMRPDSRLDTSPRSNCPGNCTLDLGDPSAHSCACRNARSDREIERWLSRREAEGLSLRELSARSGIPTGTLAWWSHRLRNEESEPEFVDQGVVELNPPDVPTGAAPELVLRRADGLIVEARGRIADRLVERLLSERETC